jgi:hypothetical protein
MAEPSNEDLFEKVVERSGLSSIFAGKALARAFAKAGIDPRTLAPTDLTRALPEIERVLKTYLDGAEVAQNMKRVAQLAR